MHLHAQMLEGLLSKGCILGLSPLQGLLQLVRSSRQIGCDPVPEVQQLILLSGQL